MGFEKKVSKEDMIWIGRAMIRKKLGKDNRKSPFAK
jgi:hypothetical protein